ncbi:hypothetical protein DL96DRAFT_1816729 [Flagelloscypha sp. PMI_526]|nr:hypothetical protein DL96DRAFT_1816729 [Flagelloscypha sp. PMI_526]
MPAELPEDILHLIAQYLPGSALKRFSLVSHLLRQISRPFLYETVIIEDVGRWDHVLSVGSIDIPHLHEWLVQFPEIARYIRCLKFRYWRTISPESHPFRKPLRRPECTDEFAAVLDSLPNLVSLSIIRWGQSPSTPSLTATNPSLPWAWVAPSIQTALKRALKLPSLKEFHFRDCYEFDTYEQMLEALQCDQLSSIDSLTLHSQRVISPYDEIGLSTVAPKTTIKTLRLASLATPSYSHRLIVALDSPRSPFDITHLVSLELFGLHRTQESGWLLAILNCQADHQTLRHISLLESLSLHLPLPLFWEKLKRFTSICSATLLWDCGSETSHRSVAGDSLDPWLMALSQLTSLEHLTLIWVPEKTFHQTGTVNPLLLPDKIIADVLVPKLKQVVIQVQRAIDLETDAEEVYSEMRLDFENRSLVDWVQNEISTRLLPLSYMRGVVTVDVSRLA